MPLPCQVWICPLLCVVCRVDTITSPTTPPQATRVISLTVTPDAALGSAAFRAGAFAIPLAEAYLSLVTSARQTRDTARLCAQTAPHIPPRAGWPQARGETRTARRNAAPLGPPPPDLTRRNT